MCRQCVRAYTSPTPQVAQWLQIRHLDQLEGRLAKVELPLQVLDEQVESAHGHGAAAIGVQEVENAPCHLLRRQPLAQEPLEPLPRREAKHSDERVVRVLGEEDLHVLELVAVYGRAVVAVRRRCRLRVVEVVHDVRQRVFAAAVRRLRRGLVEKICTWRTLAQWASGDQTVR